MNIVAGILIGGASRRMGRPKALLRVRPDGSIVWDESPAVSTAPVIGGRVEVDAATTHETLLERTVRIAAEVTDEVVLLGRPAFELPPTLRSLEVIEDRHPGIGPIAGLDAAFAARPGCAVLLLACDMPGITSALLRRLTPLRSEQAVAFATGPAAHACEPCAALYLPDCAPLVARQISRRDFAMKSLIQVLNARKILIGPESSAALANLNTPPDCRLHGAP